MVYNSTQDAYENMMQALPTLFEGINTDDEYLSDDVLGKLEAECKSNFSIVTWCRPMTPEMCGTS